MTLVPSSSSSNAPPCESVLFYGFLCSLRLSTGFDVALSDGVRDFRTLRPDLVARIMLSLVLARTAASSRSFFLPAFSVSLSSSSEATSTQSNHFDLPFSLGVTFLMAIPFFFADRDGVLGAFFAGVVGGVDGGRHV